MSPSLGKYWLWAKNRPHFVQFCVVHTRFCTYRNSQQYSPRGGATLSNVFCTTNNSFQTRELRYLIWKKMFPCRKYSKLTYPCIYEDVSVYIIYIHVSLKTCLDTSSDPYHDCNSEGVLSWYIPIQCVKIILMFNDLRKAGGCIYYIPS